jgi:hypothetical protein
MSKTPLKQGICLPEICSKKLQKIVDTPVILCDISATHGNNRTKKQENI